MGMIKRAIAALALAAAATARTKYFNGPMAGKYYRKYSRTRTARAKSNCILKNIYSCNSKIKHTQNWCWIQMQFSNCKTMKAMSGACPRGRKTGKYQRQNVSGYATEIMMYSDGWKGKMKEPQPSGFYIKFSKSGWSRLFGGKGKTSRGRMVKKWKGKGRIIGITYDTSGQSDFLQFHMAYNASF